MTLNAAEPWDLALDAIPGAAFHAVTAGTAWHIPSARAGTALDATLRLLAHETGQPGLGSAAVLNRIVDILFVQLLRAWLDAGPERTAAVSWLGALTGPVAGGPSAAVSVNLLYLTAIRIAHRVDGNRYSANLYPSY